jgi:hypothetical protein
MAPTLTLHQGEARAEYVEHPIEVARRALREAARLEWESGTDRGRSWAGTLARIVDSLPERAPIKRKEA